MTRTRNLTASHAAPRGRAGTSLLEVLVGLGIMAVGAIGAFVLFPLSAINVSRALIDDRATTCAVTADGQLRDIHRRVVQSRGGEVYFTHLGGTASATDNPSPAVFIDPMGFFARGGLDVGDAAETGIKRCSLGGITNSTIALRFCSQMDGLTFNEGGDVPQSPSVDLRELRYNWLWVVQRPIARDHFNVRMQVVVFDKRTHMFAPPGTEAVYGLVKGTPGLAFVPGSSTITGVPAAAEVRKGSWVMDATIRGNLDGDGVARPIQHAEFYRVTSVTEMPNGTLSLEVHRPLVRADGRVDRVNPPKPLPPSLPLPGVTYNLYEYEGTLVVMPAVVEVFERPMLTDNNQ